MDKAKVSVCANPDCETKFKRMGTGKLYVRPMRNSSGKRVQKALWLCAKCALEFDLRYNRLEQTFELVRRKTA